MKLLWLAGIAALLAPAAIADPLTVLDQGQPVVEASRGEYALPGTSLLDPYKLERLSDELAGRLFRAPRNARIGPGERIVPEETGRKLDRPAFAEHFYRYYYGSGPASVEAPFEAVYPKVDRELLADIREKHIGQYLTYYNPRNKNRSHNIALAAKAIDSVVVFPGETFSFNQVVGKRTREKGYLEAPIIVRGELSEGIGGGICQVSSTLFNAIDRAGLHVVKRYSHSRHVPYVRPGRDATVSWDGPDFVFRNDYNQPVLIRAHSAGGRLFVAVYSSDRIEYKPREVPGMSKQLPQETDHDTEDRRS